MTTDEHLDLIAAKCRELLATAETETCSHTPESVAAYKSTIAAIELLEMLDICGGFSTDKEVQETIQSILAAWLIELLKP